MRSPPVVVASMLSQLLAGCFVDEGADTMSTSGGASEPGSTGPATDPPTSTGTCQATCETAETAATAETGTPTTTDPTDTPPGGATFTLAADTEVTGATTLAAGRLDEDALADLVVVSDAKLSLIFGADLTQPTAYDVGGASALALRDLDGDGVDEILAAGGGSLRVFRAAVGLPQDTSIDVACMTAEAIALGRVNPDMHDDILLACGADGVHQLAADQNGGFLAPTKISAAPAGDVGISDLLGSEALDLAYVDTAMDGVAVLPGTGTLNGWNTDDTTVFKLESAIALALGDVDADGFADVVAASGAAMCQTFLGSVSGVVPAADFECALVTHDIALGDLDGDDTLDVVTARSGSVDVAFGRGDGTFGPPDSYPAGPELRHLALADFNGDARLDIAASRFNGFVVLLQDA